MHFSAWIIVYFIGVVEGCILLLNGWEPLPVTERAILADIVLVAKCVKSFQYESQSSDTYSATFKIQNILKGENYIADLRIIHGRQDVFNVTNFGDKQMCYSEVIPEETYLLFLTIYEHRLSAKYDDLFGATAESSDHNVEEILKALGWQHWSRWGACTTSCGGGTQARRRECVSKNPSACDITREETRECNTFKCKGAKNLINIFKLTTFPSGVTKSNDRSTAFVIDITSSIHTPTSKIFPRNFPKEFSVVITAKPQLNNNGFILTISDLLGFIKLGVQVGSNPRFIYSNDMNGGNSDSNIRFPVNLSDGKWHQFAFSVRKKNVTLILDCDVVITRSFQPISDFQIGSSTVTSLGKSFIESSHRTRYQGEIEDLMIINNPFAAWQQCSKDHSMMQSDNGQITESSNSISMKENEDNYGETTWSEWSDCSVSCGRGVRARVAYCSPSVQEPMTSSITSPCKNDVIGTTQTKKCTQKRCPVRCRTTCFNGGTCRKNRCSCPEGYYGKQCEIVSCNPGCYNGGKCVEPDKCSCPAGYSGPQCEEAACDPKCRNGGHCIRPGVCSCPYGFMAPDCSPMCNMQCLNGGSCTAYNQCSCPRGYSGSQCQTAICSRGCGPMGRCVAPETCMCSAGYIGSTCETPVCQPSCRNGGTCILPFFCACPSGTYGSTCEHHICRPGCLNGGTCIDKKCLCPPTHHGDSCEKVRCPGECFNGGTCTAEGVCRCAEGYQGPSCNERDCNLRAYREPIQKRYRKLVTTREPYPCGFLGWKTCHRTRRRYKPAFKTYFRVVYRCDETTE